MANMVVTVLIGLLEKMLHTFVKVYLKPLEILRWGWFIVKSLQGYPNLNGLLNPMFSDPDGPQKTVLVVCPLN